MKNDSPPWQEDPKNPTRQSGEKRKDKYGNEIKNVAKHLARKAMNAVKEAVNKNATEKEVRTPLNAKIIEHDNCGTPECCGQCDTAEIDEGVTNPEIKKAYADLIKTPSGSSERKSAIRRYKSLRQNAVKEESELEEAHGMWKVDFPKQHAGKAVAAGSVHVKAQNTAHAHKVAAKRVGVDHKVFKSKVTKSSILPEEVEQVGESFNNYRKSGKDPFAQRKQYIAMDRAEKKGVMPGSATSTADAIAAFKAKGGKTTKLDTKGNMKEGHMPTSDEPTAANKKTADKVRAMMAKEKKPVKEEVEGKVYSVHVKGDSKDHNSPEFKKHLKGWGGELHYASDKGAAYKFKKGYQATGFHHGVKSGFKSLDSEHDGHVNEETLTEISAKGVSARDEFRQKIQRAMSDPANLARAKKVIARKKAKAKEAAANEPKNLVHQLHKSQSINAKVKFYDGKEHEIAPNHHDKFMNKYHGLKSSIEKESLVKRAHKSHEDFLKAIHEEFADFSQEKPNTDSITPANYPTPPVRDDITDYNSDDRHDEYDMVAIENDVAAQIENSEWEDLVFYYDDEDLNYEDSDEDIAEGITPQGRLKKRFNMMRSKSRRNMARNLALKRVATPDRIKSRSVRAARNMVYSRVLRGRDRSTLSATEKTRIEGMVKRMAPMVGRLSLRLQQKERMIDRKRINNRNKRKKK
jgi:hypothetical protein